VQPCPVPKTLPYWQRQKAHGMGPFQPFEPLEPRNGFEPPRVSLVKTAEKSHDNLHHLQSLDVFDVFYGET